jgi:hypothetical protein
MSAAAVDVLFAQNADTKEFRKAVKTLRKIHENILTHPQEAKYRSLKKETILARLAPFKGSDYVLAAAGFCDSGTHLVLSEMSSLVQLQAGFESIQRHMTRFTPQGTPATTATAVPAPVHKSPEQLQLERVLAENTRIAREAALKKKKYRAEMAAKSAAARRETAQRIVTASRANTLAFGATVAVHKPPPPAKRG